MTCKEENLSDAQLLRLKPEEKLKKNKKAGTGINESDTKKLVHELQVHQIELEMPPGSRRYYRPEKQN